MAMSPEKRKELITEYKLTLLTIFRDIQDFKYINLVPEEYTEREVRLLAECWIAYWSELFVVVRKIITVNRHGFNIFDVHSLPYVSSILANNYLKIPEALRKAINIEGAPIPHELPELKEIYKKYMPTVYTYLVAKEVEMQLRAITNPLKMDVPLPEPIHYRAVDERKKLKIKGKSRKKLAFTVDKDNLNLTSKT